MKKGTLASFGSIIPKSSSPIFVSCNDDERKTEASFRVGPSYTCHLMDLIAFELSWEAIQI